MVLLCLGFLAFALNIQTVRAFGQTSYETQPSGLVGYWNFDEGSGTIINDSSGYGNNGTIYGASWTGGKMWSALGFDGLDDYVDCGDNETLDPTQEATIEAWVKFDQLPSVAGHIMAISGRSGGGTDLDVQAEPDNRLKFYIGPGVFVASSTVIETSKWYHVAATYEAYNSTRIYVNGLLEATTPIFGARGPNPNSFWVGESLWGGRFFNGTIDEVRLYNRTLSAQEIWAEYTRTSVFVSHSSDIMDVGQSQQFNSSIYGGASPYTYQWYLNDASVSGATGASWMFTPSTLGAYTVYLNATDDAGASEESNTIIVSVNEALSVTISPTSVTMNMSESQLFTAQVSGGTSPYSYQWYLNDTAVSGANSTSWTFAPNSIGNFTVHVRVNDAVSSTAVAVKVGSVVVVPEFQPFTLLLLFMIITLLGVVVFKNSASRKLARATKSVGIDMN